MPDRLYKYTSCAAAAAIIQNCTLKLSVPTAFNDPFDILLGEALGSEVEDFLRDLMPAFFDLASGELDVTPMRPGVFKDQIVFINQQLRRLTPEALAVRRVAWLQQPPEGIWADPEFLRQSNQLVVGTIQAQLGRYGVFCSATNKDSLLMWSHYADHHRGVVLELRPDVPRDSPLMASKPIVYSTERPLLYRSPHDLLRKSLLLSAEDAARELVEPLIYTKSTEWAYESEYRLAIPDYVPAGATERFIEFYPTELCGVLFGCRVTDERRREIEGLARTLNPGVRFSRAVMARREYALEWVDD